MTNSGLLLSVLLLGMSGVPGSPELAVPQEKQQPQENQQPPEGQQGLQLPRVAGEPRSKLEYDDVEDWMVVHQTEDAAERARLATEFLENHPDSGLTAFAHRILANAAYQRNDIENFILHGEKVILELPKTPELLVPLAYLYSERRESVKATKYAEAALPLLEQTARPAGIGSLQWVTDRQGLKADAHYALGRSHLEMRMQSVGSPEELEQAVEHLNQTLELDAGHGYAAFRLGFAHRRSRDFEAALAAYARACVIEGPAAGPARKHLERVHKNLQANPESRWANKSIEEILEEERKLLATKQEEQGLELARLAAEVDRLEQERLEQESLEQQSPGSLEQEKEATPPRN